MDWRCGSSDRAPALQVQTPEIKSQSHKKKKKIKGFECRAEKEHLQFLNKKTAQLYKQQKKIRRVFSKECIQLADQHMIASLVIKERQIPTMGRHHHTYQDQRVKIRSVCKEMEQSELPHRWCERNMTSSVCKQLLSSIKT
jgi:ribosomal protein L34E